MQDLPLKVSSLFFFDGRFYRVFHCVPCPLSLSIHIDAALLSSLSPLIVFTMYFCLLCGGAVSSCNRRPGKGSWTPQTQGSARGHGRRPWGWARLSLFCTAGRGSSPSQKISTSRPPGFSPPMILVSAWRWGSGVSLHHLLSGDSSGATQCPHQPGHSIAADIQSATTRGKRERQINGGPH